MSEEKIDAKLDQASGKVKETFGKATGDKRTEAEGKAEHTSGKVKEFFSDVKDSVDGAVDGVRKAFDKDDDKR